MEYFVHQEAKDQESGNKKIDHPRSFPACLADCETSTMMVKIESSTTQAIYSIRIKVCLEIEMPPIVFFFWPLKNNDIQIRLQFAVVSCILKKSSSSWQNQLAFVLQASVYRKI